MTTLLEFIEQRLAEDERTALATGPETVWRPDSAWAADLLNPLPSQRRDHPGYMPMITAEDLEHIARHDPARVLREVEAKRAILRCFVGPTRDVLGTVLYGGVTIGGEHFLKLLALPYADHSDHRAEWAP